MGATGFELPPLFSVKTPNLQTGGAKSGAFSDQSVDLANLIALWARLSGTTRSAIITLASATLSFDEK
jgi:hypothetical protein